MNFDDQIVSAPQAVGRVIQQDFVLSAFDVHFAKIHGPVAKAAMHDVIQRKHLNDGILTRGTILRTIDGKAGAAGWK